MTKITIKNEYGKYSVEVDESDMTLTGMMDKLIMPVIKSVGYSQITIDKYFE
ncbi:hypothetical protein PANI_CDS0126 [Maribacter phage Panino]